MGLPKNIVKRLDDFFDSYNDKVKFLKTLLRTKQHEDEVVLLTCCYIEQLGSCLFTKAGSTKRAFESMLLAHSGENDIFSSISVGDLALDVMFFSDRIDYIVPKAGRIEFWSDEMKPIIRLVIESDISTTPAKVRQLCKAVYDEIRNEFRIHPYQTENKICCGEESHVVETIEGCLKRRRTGAQIESRTARRFVREYSYASILYREYRCKAVHEAGGLSVDKKEFWQAASPYHVPIHTSWFKYSFYTVEFPFRFLIKCLETCVRGARVAIMRKGLLPPSIWGSICKREEYDVLDYEAVKDAKVVKLRLD